MHSIVVCPSRRTTSQQRSRGAKRLGNNWRMNVLHVSPSFYPTTAYGGTIQSCLGLCRGLCELDCNVRVLTTDADGLGRTVDVPNDQDVKIDRLRVRYCHKLFRHSISLDLLKVLGEYIGWADV